MSHAIHDVPYPREQAAVDRRATAAAHPQGHALDECLEALELWLRWDEQHRQLTEALMEGNQDLHRIEEQMDCCDLLRQRAAMLSRRALQQLKARS